MMLPQKSRIKDSLAIFVNWTNKSYIKIWGKLKQKTPLVIFLLFGCLFLFYILQDLSLTSFQSSRSSLIRIIKYKHLKGIVSNEHYNLPQKLNFFWNWISSGKPLPQKSIVNKLYPNDTKYNKIILLWTHFFNSPTWYYKDLNKIFSGCKYKACKVVTEKNYLNQANALLIHYRNLPYFDALPESHPYNQIWIFFLVESPPHTCDFVGWNGFCNLNSYDGAFNWTGTYMSHSDIVVPYVSYHKLPQPRVNPTPSRNLSLGEGRNWAAGRSKLAASFISNCNTVNNRLQYVKELGQYLKPDAELDVYGQCGSHPTTCSRKSSGEGECEASLLAPYKFYFAFENSNCVEYVTEKSYRALKYGLVPVVYGARYPDYVAHLPPMSFVYVASPLDRHYQPVPGEDLQNSTDTPPYHPHFTTSNLRDLAEYLKFLNTNDTAYNSYHAWRALYAAGPGPSSETYMCQICRHLHLGDIPPKSYQISRWWNKDTACAV